MKRLPAAALAEAAIWLLLAALAYYYSFQFDKSIEIYRFGASGWPRAVILLMVAAAICQLIVTWRRGGDAQTQDMLAAQETEAEESGERGVRYYLRVTATLLLPLIYALLLERVGFYVLTPIFILLFLLLAGERRPRYLIGVTVGIYAVLVFVFGRLLYINLPTGNMQPFYDFSNWLLVIIR
ncbi:MAG: tripartite tricarboxylate transporter TctB family protein [Gammaproteobacteria bacterium]